MRSHLLLSLAAAVAAAAAATSVHSDEEIDESVISFLTGRHVRVALGDRYSSGKSISEVVKSIDRELVLPRKAKNDATRLFVSALVPDYYPRGARIPDDSAERVYRAALMPAVDSCLGDRGRCGDLVYLITRTPILSVLFLKYAIGGASSPASADYLIHTVAGGLDRIESPSELERLSNASAEQIYSILELAVKPVSDPFQFGPLWRVIRHPVLSYIPIGRPALNPAWMAAFGRAEQAGALGDFTAEMGNAVVQHITSGFVGLCLVMGHCHPLLMMIATDSARLLTALFVKFVVADPKRGVDEANEIIAGVSGTHRTMMIDEAQKVLIRSTPLKVVFAQAKLVSAGAVIDTIHSLLM